MMAEHSPLGQRLIAGAEEILAAQRGERTLITRRVAVPDPDPALAALQAEVAALREEVAHLRAAIGLVGSEAGGARAVTAAESDNPE
jgi:hypothetical protein